MPQGAPLELATALPANIGLAKEVTNNEKHSRLLQHGFNCTCKRCIVQAPGAVFTTIHSLGNVLIGPIN